MYDSQKQGRIATLCVLLIIAVFMLAGCSSGGGSSDATAVTTTPTTTNPPSNDIIPTGSVRLNGTVASASGAAAFRAGSAPALTTDAVWAVPIAKMQGATIDATNVMLRKSLTLSSDGTFSFLLEKTMTLADIKAKIPTMDTGGMPDSTVLDVDWMLVEMAGSTPVSVIALKGDATYDSLLSIPLSEFTPSTINVGSVDSSTGAATFTVSSLASDVTMSASSLAALARTDDILGTIKDVIRNCDLITNKCKKAYQSFVFMGTYANLIDPVAYDKGGTYTGYQIYFDLNDYFTKTDFDGLCPTSGSASIMYTLTPPDVVTVGSITYSPSNPMSSGTGTGNSSTMNNDTETQCFKTDLALRKSNTANHWDLQFLTGEYAVGLAQASPAGDWVLKRSTDTVNFTEVARFEFSLAKPVDANGNPIIFIPAIRFDTDGSADAKLTTLHIKWYQYIGSGYVEVTDAALLKSLLGTYQISLDDDDGIAANPTRRSDQINGIEFTTTSIDVTNLGGNGAFYYNPTDQTIQYKLTYFGVSYNFGGQSFRFAWR